MASTILEQILENVGKGAVLPLAHEPCVIQDFRLLEQQFIQQMERDIESFANACSQEFQKLFANINVTAQDLEMITKAWNEVAQNELSESILKLLIAGQLSTSAITQAEPATKMIPIAPCQVTPLADAATIELSLPKNERPNKNSLCKEASLQDTVMLAPLDIGELTALAKGTSSLLASVNGPVQPLPPANTFEQIHEQLEAEQQAASAPQAQEQLQALTAETSEPQSNENSNQQDPNQQQVKSSGIPVVEIQSMIDAL